jgi:hypothetical protein
MRKGFLVLTIFTVLGVPTVVRAQTAPDTWVIRGGALFADFGSDVRIDATTERGQGSTDISLEHDLGFNKNNSMYWVEGVWRGKGKSRVHVSYTSVSRDVSNTPVTRTITFRDKTFTVGSHVDAFFDTKYIAADYGLAFVRKPQGEFGASVGVSILKYQAGIDLTANVNGGGDVQRNLNGNEEITAPVPVAGIFFQLRPHPRVAITGTWRGIFGSVGDFTGNVSEVQAGVDYKLVGPLGVGGAYYYNIASLTGKGTPLGGHVTYRFNGPQVYGVLSFK